MTDLSPKTARRFFWSIAVLHLAAWTILPSLLQPGYRLDVVELIFIGKEWVLQTNKHPQFPAWLNEIIYQASGGAGFTPFLASQLCVAACLFSIWRVARDLLKSEWMGIMAVLTSVAGYWYFNYEATQYNANTTLTAACAAATGFLYFALKTDRTRYWIATGIAIACGFYSKYTMIFWVLAALIYLVFDRNGRRFWKKSGPYWTTAVAFLLFLPHLTWLACNDYPCLKYARDMVEQPSPWMHLKGPFDFFLEQAGFIAPLLLLSVPVLGWRFTRRKILGDEKTARSFFACVLFAPFAMHMAISAVFALDIVNDYGAQFWPFLTTFLFFTFENKVIKKSCEGTDPPIVENYDAKGIRRAVTLCALLWSIMLLCLVGQSVLSPYIKGKPLRIHFPGPGLAAHVDRTWHDRFDVPCPYFTGEWWPAGNAANNSVDRPTVHFYYFGMDKGKEPSANWSSDEDVNERGGVVFWEIGRDQSPEYVPDYLFERFPAAEVEPGVIELPYQTGAKIPPARIRIAVIPPRGNLHIEGD